MITYICRTLHRYTADEFIDAFGDRLRGHFQVLTYEEIFRAHALPVGHTIFTDFDRLTPYQREAAANMAAAVTQVEPQARILNHPLRVKERYELLRALKAEGINDFEVARLDEGRRPERYPVFLRREDDALGPETALLADEAAFDAALARMRAQNQPLKGRLWIQYRAEPDAQGRFRKYSAFRIGDRIMAYHLQIGTDWTVKRASGILDPADYAEELAYIKQDPHAEVLRRAFDLAGIDYGRADYTVAGGAPRIFEINTNPSMPKRPKTQERPERRQIIQPRFLEWMLALDSPLARKGWVRFPLPQPVQEILPRGGRGGLRLLIAGRWRARSPRSGRWARKAG